MGDLFSLPEEITSSKLFQSALTHRSAGKDNNERLEFLGDAVLGFIIANQLYTKFPDYDEGDLSRLRAHLVCKKALAKLAKNAGLGATLKLGSGEKKSGGHFRSSILADSLEAIIGAIYLLKGFEYTQDFVSVLYADQFKQLPHANELKDPKTRLQEYLQSKQIDVPEYIVLEERGNGNEKIFKIECFVQSLGKRSVGVEKSKKKAEQFAASEMIKLLQEQ